MSETAPENTDTTTQQDPPQDAPAPESTPDTQPPAQPDAPVDTAAAEAVLAEAEVPVLPIPGGDELAQQEALARAADPNLIIMRGAIPGRGGESFAYGMRPPQ